MARKRVGARQRELGDDALGDIAAQVGMLVARLNGGLRGVENVVNDRVIAADDFLAADLAVGDLAPQADRRPGGLADEVVADDLTAATAGPGENFAIRIEPPWWSFPHFHTP